MRARVHAAGLLALLVLWPCACLRAAEEAAAGEAQRRWGVAIGVRYAGIPFDAPDETHADLVPLLYYHGERVFIDGLEGGIELARGGAWRLNAFGRYRFLGLPAEAETDARSDSWDVGLQLRHPLLGSWEGRWELLSAGDGRAYLDAGVEALFGDAYASLRPYVGVRLKSSEFNQHYFGLGREALGTGADLHARIEARAHLYRNLYLIGRIGGFYLDADARRSRLMEEDRGWHAFLGVGMFEPPQRGRRRPIGARPYWRLSHGRATGSSLGDIVLRGDIERHRYQERLTSLFYGHPVADELFGWPLAIYLTPGLVYHHSSAAQGRAIEYVAAIKAYYTFRWPVRVRLGLAEGLSYVSQVPHPERSELEAKGDEPSKFMNYLDVSVDLSLGDLFGSPAARELWLGFGVHHRSGIFETGSQFGHISGGSNYNTLYLQWHY